MRCRFSSSASRSMSMSVGRSDDRRNKRSNPACLRRPPSAFPHHQLIAIRWGAGGPQRVAAGRPRAREWGQLGHCLLVEGSGRGWRRLGVIAFSGSSAKYGLRDRAPRCRSLRRMVSARRPRQPSLGRRWAPGHARRWRWKSSPRPRPSPRRSGRTVGGGHAFSFAPRAGDLVSGLQVGNRPS